MTYESIKKQIAESGEELPISAKNENGELVIIEERFSEEGNPYYKLTTVQNNNWRAVKAAVAADTA